MALHTVNVSVKGLFHNGMPFEGILRVKLSAPADGGDNTLILPKEWQEIRFTPNGEAVAQLVPNTLLGEGSFYQFEIVTVKNTGAYIYDKYGKKTTVERGVIVVPDRDCAFTEIVTLEPTKPEPLEASKAYASEAKETLRETKEVAASVAGSADKEIKRIEQESETIREDALKAINEEGERVKGIVDDNIETANNAAKRAEDAEGRVAGLVNVELPAKAEAIDKALNNKVNAIDAHLESAQTTILGNIDSKANEVSTALDGKVAQANQAKNDAVKAKDEAVASATNAMRYTYAEPVADGSGTITLVDRAVNKVTVDDAVTFAMPPAIDGKVRDFMIDLTISEETSVIFDGVVLPRDGDDSNLIPEVGRNIFLLTEVEQNTFLCSRCTIAEVAV